MRDPAGRTRLSARGRSGPGPGPAARPDVLLGPVLDRADDGQTLLVTGAAGAVGGYTVALAAGRGLHVVALAGAADEDAVRSWGATTLVARADDPAGGRAVDAGRRVDGAIDAADLGAPVLP